MMPRVVAVERLDGLPADHPDAIRSRRDLRRVHRAMGTRTLVLRGLRAMTARHPKARPLRVLEIGAGDGSLLLGVAQALAPCWPGVELTLLDRQALLTPTTMARYREVGWTVTQAVGDVLDWAVDQGGSKVDACWDLIVANLFLHHFDGPQLDLILRFAAHKSLGFLACEPRRDWLALAGSHLIGVIGVNHVTREDSVLSVHAGFNGHELTARWPHQGDSWNVQEYSAGLFSHCLRAERTGLNP